MTDTRSLHLSLGGQSRVAWPIELPLVPHTQLLTWPLVVLSPSFGLGTCLRNLDSMIAQLAESPPPE